jgi:hypothetical protein
MCPIWLKHILTTLKKIRTPSIEVILCSWTWELCGHSLLTLAPHIVVERGNFQLSLKIIRRVMRSKTGIITGVSTDDVPIIRIVYKLIISELYKLNFA